jgi:hypothetical protein
LESVTEDATLRFLTTPLRFMFGMLMWAVFLLISPLLFVVTVMFGIRFMSPDEIGLSKVLLVVLSPFALVLWWIIIRRVTNDYRAKRLIAHRNQTGNDFSDSELNFLERADEPRHIRSSVVLLVSFAASVYCAHVFYNSGDQQFFVGVLAGIFSPAIIVAAYKALNGI